MRMAMPRTARLARAARGRLGPMSGPDVAPGSLTALTS